MTLRLRMFIATLALASVLPSTALGQDDPQSMSAMVHEVAAGYAERAREAEHSGQALEAEVLYLRAVETDPGLLAAWLGYARTLDGRQHHDEAVAMLAHIPSRALATEHDRAELARTLAAMGRTDDALAMLRDRDHSPEAMRALTDLAAAAGRFPQALAAARRLAELAGDGEHAHEARVLVRALGRLVAEADAVRAVPTTAPPLRRLLRNE